jgi:hypothetical protein
MLFHSTASEALKMASNLASAPPHDWSDPQWLSLATGALSAALSDASWLPLCIFAHEQRADEAGFLDGLDNRVNLIAKLGDDSGDPFRDPRAVFDRVRALIASQSAAAALEMYQAAVSAVFTSARDSEEWLAARDGFLRGRRLRRAGHALRRLSESGIALPDDLLPWVGWATYREEDGKVVCP